MSLICEADTLLIKKILLECHEEEEEMEEQAAKANLMAVSDKVSKLHVNTWKRREYKGGCLLKDVIAEGRYFWLCRKICERIKAVNSVEGLKLMIIGQEVEGMVRIAFRLGIKRKLSSLYIIITGNHNICE